MILQTVEKFLKVSGYETTDEHIVLNGYHFIFVNPDLNGTNFSEATQAWLAKELEEAAADDPTGIKPIFVFQQEHIRGTVYGSEDWGVPELTHILEQYSQVVAFSFEVQSYIFHTKNIILCYDIENAININLTSDL